MMVWTEQDQKKKIRGATFVWNDWINPSYFFKKENLKKSFLPKIPLFSSKGSLGDWRKNRGYTFFPECSVGSHRSLICSVLYSRQVGVKLSQQVRQRKTEMGAFLWCASPNGICSISDPVSSCEQTCRWQEARCWGQCASLGWTEKQPAPEPE